MKDLCKECSVSFSTLNRLQTFWVFWKLPTLYFRVLHTSTRFPNTRSLSLTCNHHKPPVFGGTRLGSFLKTNTPLTSVQYPWYWVSLHQVLRKWTGHVKEECLSFPKHKTLLKTVQWRTNENHLCPDFLHSHFVLKTQDFSSMLVKCTLKKRERLRQDFGSKRDWSLRLPLSDMKRNARLKSRSRMAWMDYQVTTQFCVLLQSPLT